MFQSIDIDILTNYSCNNNCKYCFLAKMHNDNKIIDVNKLEKNLNDISKKYIINHINLYGGEVSIIPLDVFSSIINLCKKYADINVITNFSNDDFLNFLFENNINVSTSINNERPNNELVEYKLLSNNYENITLLQVVTPSVLLESPKKILDRLNIFKKHIMFLQHSPSKNAITNYELTNKDFSIFLKNIITEYKLKDYSFKIINMNIIENSIKGKYDPSMESILFINPYNQYMSISYINNLEYFKTFNTLSDWKNECINEKKWYENKCKDCYYFGRCYAEHIKEWRKDDECCGMKSLLEWYEKDIYKNN